MAQTDIDPWHFEEGAPPRIMGTECEYLMQGRPLPTTDTNNFKLPSDIMRKLDIATSGRFWSNGAKFHPDVGHAEYATPECLGPREAAAADQAGVRLLEIINPHIQDGAAQLFRRSGTYFMSPKNPQPPATKGYHESYLTPRSIDKTVLAAAGSAFLISRLWAGSGAVTSDGFVMSQKASGIGFETPIAFSKHSATTRGGKPLMMLNDDPDIFNESQMARWARLEVRMADPGLSADIQFASMAAMSLILRLVEHSDQYGDRLLDLGIYGFAEAAHEFSKDLSLTATARTHKGKQATALDLQEELHAMASEFAEDFDIPEDEREGLEVWGKLNDAMRQSQPAKAEYSPYALEKINFALKHWLLAQKFTKRQLQSVRSKACITDHLWDRISPGGLGQTARAKLPPSEHVTDADITRLMSDPPLGTRARIRGQRIWDHASRLSSVDWASFTFRGKLRTPLKKMYVRPRPFRRYRP